MDKLIGERLGATFDKHTHDSSDPALPETTRVSVVVPLYNKAEHIFRCIHSIEAQSFTNFEAIIVDDGSSDDGVSRISGVLRNDSRFRLISQANAGPGAARN